MERGRELRRLPDDAPAIALVRARGDYRQQAIVGTDIGAVLGLHHDGAAHPADAGIHHGQEYAALGKAIDQGRKQMRSGAHIECRRIVQQIDYRDARCEPLQHRLHLADVDVAANQNR